MKTIGNRAPLDPNETRRRADTFVQERATRVYEQVLIGGGQSWIVDAALIPRAIAAVPHRIAIIGQSNSIIEHGYVAQLMRRPEVSIGHMGRMGATPSVLLPLFAGPVWFSNHDFCVIDTAVVDQLFLWAETIDPYAICQYVSYAVQMAHAAGCMPVILVIPHQAAVPEAAQPYARPFLQQLYRAAALHNDAIYLDLTEPLYRLRKKSAEGFAAAYSDPNHLAEGTSAALAERLVRLFDEIAATAIERRHREVGIPNFERLELNHLASQLNTVEYQSSVFGSTFCVLEDGASLDLQIGKFDRMHGLLINRARSSAKLAIRGSDTIVKALGSHSERDVPFLAQLVPILTPIRDRDDRVGLGIAPSSMPATEPTFQSLEHHGHHAEIAELLVQRGARTLSYGAPTLPLSLRDVAWEDQIND